MRVLYLLALFLPLVTCRVTPLLVASLKLVRGLKQEINPSNLAVHNVTSVTNMLKKLITDCSSDAYLIINLPGLTYQDLTTVNKDQWPFLRKYLYMASTLVGLPRVEANLDLDFLEQYIINTCEAETVNVFQSHEEVVDYYDVRTRVIRMDLAPLSENDEDIRTSQIYDCDQLIRKILRKLPSPHYSIIFTSLNPGVIHPIPKHIMQQDPDSFEIFSDILNDPINNQEVEKNDRFHKVEPDLNPIRHSNDKYIRNKKKDEIHLFDYELWTKNEKLVTTIFVMVVSLFMMKIVSFLKALKQKFLEYNQNKAKKGIITSTDKKKD